MDVDDLTKEYRQKCKGLTSDNIKEEIEPAIDIFSELLEVFARECEQNKYFIYLNKKPDTADDALYLAKIPDGIDAFEEWSLNGISELANKILFRLNELWPSNIGFIYVAQFLDNKNFEEFFENAKIPEDQQELIRLSYAEYFSFEELQPMVKAIGCAIIGMNNTAHDLIKSCIQQLLFEDKDIFNVIKKAREIEVISKHVSSQGKKGATNRWKKKQQVKEYAVELSHKAIYKSSSQAAKNILKQVLTFAKEINEPFTDDYQAYERICKWLRADKKSQ
jgi:hypothetical protein